MNKLTASDYGLTVDKVLAMQNRRTGGKLRRKLAYKVAKREGLTNGTKLAKRLREIGNCSIRFIDADAIAKKVNPKTTYRSKVTTTKSRSKTRRRASSYRAFAQALPIILQKLYSIERRLCSETAPSQPAAYTDPVDRP